MWVVKRQTIYMTEDVVYADLYGVTLRVVGTVFWMQTGSVAASQFNVCGVYEIKNAVIFLQ